MTQTVSLRIFVGENERHHGDLAYEWILVNGGRRGLNLRVGTQDLIRLTGARIVDAVRREAGDGSDG